MQHLLLALELQQGNSQALMDGLKIYLISQGVGITQRVGDRIAPT